MVVMSNTIEHIRITDFITLVRDSFDSSVETYTKGRCIEFCLILKYVFPSGEIMWNEDHAVFKCFDKFYDITGEVSGEGYNLRLMDYGILKINKLLKP